MTCPEAFLSKLKALSNRLNVYMQTLFQYVDYTCAASVLAALTALAKHCESQSSRHYY